MKDVFTTNLDPNRYYYMMGEMKSSRSTAIKYRVRMILLLLASRNLAMHILVPIRSRHWVGCPYSSKSIHMWSVGLVSCRYSFTGCNLLFSCWWLPQPSPGDTPASHSFLLACLKMDYSIHPHLLHFAGTSSIMHCCWCWLVYVDNQYIIILVVTIMLTWMGKFMR